MDEFKDERVIMLRSASMLKKQKQQEERERIRGLYSDNGGGI